MDKEFLPPQCPPQLLNSLRGKGERVLELQAALTAARALGPENGGEGEIVKASFIHDLLAAMKGASLTFIDSPDPRVPSGKRPNIVARFPGGSSRRLWLFGHMDVVGAGDMSAWGQDPWQVRRDGDMVFGRGVEDNQQAICPMLILAETLEELGIIPELGLGLVFMADEECGSRHGLAHVLTAGGEFFSPDDWYIVPDGGSPDASEIEIAEKAQLWLHFTVLGSQCHASNPFLGRNAFLAAAHLAIRLESGLRDAFPAKNPLFLPPVSTFVPTRHPANVEAVNIMPGRGEFYMDCRLLPELSPDAVLEKVGEIARKVAEAQKVEISFEVEHCQKSSETSRDTPLLPHLEEAIREEYGATPHLVGIGGATVAAFLRHKGLPGVVWSCLQNTCHQPNERSSLTATCKDAAVFARLLFPGLDNGR